ncbi:MAG TPA: DMT family transporter [Caulobacteraceae bacterium]|nr:DMT family transporter [Caulobacteraceae bacterium]
MAHHIAAIGYRGEMKIDRRSPLMALWNTGWLLLSLASLFWAGNAVVGRAINAEVPPIALAFWRWVLASLLILPFAWPHLRRDWPLLRKHWLVTSLLALLGVAAFNALLYTALHTTTAINGVLIQSATPPLILLFTFLLFREKAGWLQIAGLIVALAGVATIVTSGAPQDILKLDLVIGDLLIFIAVAGYALYSALLRVKPDVHPLSLVAATFVLGTLMLVPLYAAEHLSGNVIRPTPQTFAAIGFVAVFPSILAYLFYNRGVEVMGANRAGQFVHLMPAFGAVLSWAFLGEGLALHHAAGIGLIAAGVWLSSRRPAAGRPATA